MGPETTYREQPPAAHPRAEDGGHIVHPPRHRLLMPPGAALEDALPIDPADDRADLGRRVAARIQSAHARTHARPHHHVHRDRVLLEHLQHADMGEAARAATRALAERTERRIGAVRARFEQRTAAEVARLDAAAAEALERHDLLPEDLARLAAAIEVLAARLTESGAQR